MSKYVCFFDKIMGEREMKRILIGVLLILLPYQCYSDWFVAASGGITMPNIKAQDNFKQGIGLTLQTGKFILNKKAFIALSWDYLLSDYYATLYSQSGKSEVNTGAIFSNFSLNFNYFVFEGAYANIGIGTSYMQIESKSGFVGEQIYQLDSFSNDKIVLIMGVGYLLPVLDILSLKFDIYQNTDFNDWSDRNNLNLRAGLLINL